MPRLRLILPMLLLLTAGRAMAIERSSSDSIVLSRVFCYQRNFGHQVDGFASNVYTKFVYQTHKRNASLWVVPSLYPIARGQRTFISEQYGRYYFRDINDYESFRQVYYTTIPHNRRTMPKLLEFLTPSLYAPTMYGDHILSPFHRDNRSYYRYTLSELANGQVSIYFRPRFINNTQLVTGRATVDKRSGRIAQVEINGEFDMIRFRTLSMQGEYGARALLPKYSETSVDFTFMGNRVTSSFEAFFDCPITLPDSISVKGDRALMDSVRPISLSATEQDIYDHYDSLHAPRPADTLTLDTLSPTRHHNILKEIGWDLIGENLLRSMKAQGENGYVKLSPILNPQYIGYSKRKGFSYRFKLGAEYRFTEDLSLTFTPRLGYNFKLRKFYFTAPFRFTFSPEHDGYAELVWGNGNRIANSTVLDNLHQELGEQPELNEKHLDEFDDNHLRAIGHINLSDKLGIEAGLVFHQRTAVNAREMRRLGKPTEYRSLAPAIGIKTRPWAHAPLFSIDYERGLRGQNSELAYERWEADASMIHHMTRMQLLNMRLGGGIYTMRQGNYFMDYANFRDENLPGGWEDDWSGNFQLLSSRYYNESSYYLRGHVSYESPLLLVSFIPFAGRFVERERAYISSLLIDNHRPYSELGYGFTCRYFSTGLFASFSGLRYREMGCKFTFELFRRW